MFHIILTSFAILSKCFHKVAFIYNSRIGKYIEISSFSLIASDLRFKKLNFIYLNFVFKLIISVNFFMSKVKLAYQIENEHFRHDLKSKNLKASL